MTRIESTILSLALCGCVAGACSDKSDPGAPEPCTGVATITLSRATTVELLLGDSTQVTAVAHDGCGEVLPASNVNWRASDSEVVSVRDGWIKARLAGTAYVEAYNAQATARVDVLVSVPEPVGRFDIIGVGLINRNTTELWVRGDYVYTGSSTGGCGGVGYIPCESPELTSVIHVWRLDALGAPILIDSVVVSGVHLVGDVEVSSDGRTLIAGVAGATHGIVIYSLADPAAPAYITTYSTGLEKGVHTLELSTIGGREYAFLADAAPGRPMRILDITDPRVPVPVGEYYGGDSKIHDMEVRDGLAFVCHWDAGLVILDVGNGLAGGAPANPVLLSRLRSDMRMLHNATYWPERKLLFLGEEAPNGRVLVIDAADPREPEVIGHAKRGEASPHNFWLDEARGILYAAWYTDGLRAFDVSGDVSGDLYGRGLEIGFIKPEGAHGPASIWGPMMQGETIYASDDVNGLWALKFTVP